MPTIRLTQAAVEKLKPPPTRAVFWDNVLPGFGLRVTPNGKKSWVAVYRVKGGTQVWHTLGTLALVPKVEKARELARDAILQARQGINPTAERKREKAAAATAASHAQFRTVNQIAAVYFKRHVDTNYRPTWAKEVRRQFDKDILPHWGKRDVASITRADVRRLLEGVENRGPSTVNHVLAITKTFFGWMVQQEYLTRDQNPTLDIKPPNKTVERDRILSDDEIIAFWTGCDKSGWPYGPLFQLLLLTAQRRNEVGEMEWDEVDLGKSIWDIPAKRAKNGKAHIVHLSEQAISILKALPQIAGSKYVFTNTGDNPVGAWSAFKARLDKYIVVAEPFTLHDLRRTAASGMARLGIAPHVVDKVLNHTAGTIKGVARIYNKYEYGDERKTALAAWGEYVERLMHPAADHKVVSLARARG